MPRIHARSVVSLLLVLAFAGGAAGQEMPRAIPEEVGLSSARLEQLGSVLEQYVEDGRLPGAVALVARRGRVVYLEAFGQRDREAAAVLHVDDIFRIASQSKAVISVAIMMLQEEGRLLINDRLSRYLPEFAETTVAVANDEGGYDTVPSDRAIRLRDLLTHTSGIGYGGGPGEERWAEAEIQGWYFANRDEPIRQTVGRMAALPFEAQPGEKFVYGYSTDILGAVVEVVSGVPLDEFLRTRVFEPLGMRDTHFYLPADKQDRLSVVYSANDEGLVPAPDPGEMVGQGAYVQGPRASYSGGAGLLSTARDYARFLQMTLNGGELGGARILSRKSIELMTVNHVGDLLATVGGPGTGFGLGFQVVEDLGQRGTPGSVGE